jgi:O-antigen/teichoic acid export membrane protein
MVESVSKEAKVIARHSFIYGLSNVMDRLVGFVMLPVYTRFLTPADYGIMELIYMTTSIISLVIGLGIDSAVTRFYFDYKEEDKRKMVISSALLGYGGMAAAITLLVLPFSGFLARIILDSEEYTSFFVIAILTLALNMILPIVHAYLRVQQKSLLYLISKVAMTAVTLGMNIYFVVYAEMGVYGILLSNFAAFLIFTVIMVALTLMHTGLKTDYKLLKEMIKFGLPLIPSNISAYLVHTSDRFFVKAYADITTTGLYSLGYKMGTLVNTFVTSPFIQIWAPRRMEFFDQPGSERIYARIFTYFCTLSLFVGLMISLLAKEIIHFMAAEQFWPAYKVVSIVTLCYIVFSFHYHFNIGIMMKKATKYVAYTNVASGLLNIVLNFILIKKYTIWGAAAATLICFMLKVALTYYYSNKLYKITMEWGRLTVLFGVAFGIYFLAFQISTGSIWLDIAVKSMIGLSFPIVLYIFRFFSEDEIRRLKHIIKTRSFEYGTEK